MNIQDSSDSLRRCSRCSEQRPVSNFRKNSRSRDGLNWWCRPCLAEYQREWAARNPDKAAANQRNEALRRCGAGPEHYAERLEAQNGVCAICHRPETHRATSGRPRRYLAVDHNHSTNTLRGLLCSACNMALGGFRDDSDLLRAAADYLDHWADRAAKENL